MSRILLLLVLVVPACGAVGGDAPSASSGRTVVAPCRVSGCSSQLCSETDAISTCEWKDEYACYRAARCEPQEDGACGWTPTPELLACLEAARGR